MEQPVLLVLAAGMGSRYGGLKQMEPVGPSGELIIDYSLYDARQAGFKKVVFVIKKEIDSVFRQVIGDRIEENMEVAYAYQELTQLPEEIALPEGREKPWGTTHALLAARPMIHGPFAVINADDYYGPSAYKAIYEFLIQEKPQDGKSHFAMVSYLLKNTVTDNGSVARGVCSSNADGYLANIAEHTNIEKQPSGIRYSRDGGGSWHDLDPDTLVSMNFWGLDPSFFPAAQANFLQFLRDNLALNPLKGECLLPNTIGSFLAENLADVKVFASQDRWHGVTYKEDRPGVVQAIAALHTEGVYPSPLWANLKR